MNNNALLQEAFEKQATRSTPAKPLDSPTFVKSHLAISSGEYDQVHRIRNQRIIESNKSNLRMKELIDATADDFLYHLQHVGHIYGWDKRKKYQPENRAELDKTMMHEKTRLYEFLVNGEAAGFCLTTAIEHDEKKIETIDRFKQQRRLPANSTAIEIDKFGLYDEFTGKGYGDFFLAKMLKILLERDKYGIVYLDTRDTNHRGVLNFYSDHGIDVFFQEELANDLIEGTPQIHPRPEGEERNTIEINGDTPHHDENVPKKEISGQYYE